jgi:hypothetical protein
MDERDVAELSARSEGEQRVVGPAVMAGEELEHGSILTSSASVVLKN